MEHILNQDSIYSTKWNRKILKKTTSKIFFKYDKDNIHIYQVKFINNKKKLYSYINTYDYQMNHEKNKINKKHDFYEFLRHIIINYKLDDLNTSPWIDNTYFVNFEKIKYNKSNLDMISTGIFEDCEDEYKNHEKNSNIVGDKLSNFYYMYHNLCNELYSFRFIVIITFVLFVTYRITDYDLFVLVVVYTLSDICLLIYILYLVVLNINNHRYIKDIFDALNN